MKTKIAAARDRRRAPAAPWRSCEGAVDRPADRARRRARACTWFEPRRRPAAARKRWILGDEAARPGRGRRRRGHRARRAASRCCPPASPRVEGSFRRGDPVEIVGAGRGDGRPGLAGYDAGEARLIMGHRSDRIAEHARPSGPRGAGPPRRPGALSAATESRRWTRSDRRQVDLMQEIGRAARAGGGRARLAPSRRRRTPRSSPPPTRSARGRDAILAANASDMATREREGPGRGDARPAAARRGARRAASSTGCASIADQPDPVGAGAGRMGPPHRPAHPPGPHPDRRDRRHLREPPQRDRRRRRALPQGGQCRDPARRLGEPALARARSMPASSPACARPACPRPRSSWSPPPTAPRSATMLTMTELHRRDRAARRQGPGRPRPGRGAGAGLRPSRGHLPHLRRPRRRPREGARASSSTPRPGAPASAARPSAC